MKIFDQSIRGFLEEASSKSPTPGGGGIAALAAALGASMGSMVASLTRGPKYEAVHEQMIQLIEQMKSAIYQLEDMVQQDSDSFQQYLKAAGLPKGTEDEKAARSLAMQEAAQQAVDVPIHLIKHCVEWLQLLNGIAKRINKNVLSDLGIAVILLEAAVQSAWITVEINLKGLNNEELIQYYRETGTIIVNQALETKITSLREIKELIEG